MKKTPAVLLCSGILLFITAAGTLITGQRPDTLRQDVVCRGRGGSLYAAQNKDEGYAVYEIDYDRQVRNAFTEQKWFGRENTCVTALYYDEQLYMLTRQENTDGSAQYLIRKLSADLTAEETGHPLLLEKQQPLRLYGVEGQLMLDAVSEDYQTGYVYRLQIPETAKAACRLVLTEQGEYQPNERTQAGLLEGREPIYCSPDVRIMLAESDIVRMAVGICMVEALAGILALIGDGKRRRALQGFLILYLVFGGSIYAGGCYLDRQEEQHSLRQQMSRLEQEARQLGAYAAASEKILKEFAGQQRKYAGYEEPLNIERVDLVRASQTSFAFVRSSNQKQALTEGNFYPEEMQEWIRQACLKGEGVWRDCISNGFGKECFLIPEYAVNGNAAKEQYALAVWTRAGQPSAGKTQLKKVLAAVFAAGTGFLWSIFFYISTGMNGTLRKMEENALRQTQKNRYFDSLMYRACRRFTPQGMEMLLRKKDVLDLAAGDYADRRIAVAVLYSEKTECGQAEDYLRQCTREIETMRQILLKRRGILLADGCGLTQWRLLFPGRSGDAVSFAAEALSLLQPAGQLLVLFEDVCVCGIAGSPGQAFPVFLSRQAQLLETYREPLRAAGLRIVLTQDIAECVEDKRRLRYIGFMEETGCTIRLFESLDVYEEELRVNRLKTKPIFEKALELYYQNDFYLARNEFSGVLKECTQDGVAKWYLFQCEKQLEAKAQEEISHALFADCR